MAQIRFGNKWILAEIETTYGTDPTPTASDSIRASDLTVSPYEGSVVERTYDRSSMGSYPSINVAPYVSVTFSVELAPAGSAAGAPYYSKLLRACGLQESDVSAESSITAWAAAATITVGLKRSTSSPTQYWIATAAHTSAAGNKPGTSGGAAYWREYYPTVAAKKYAPRDASFESATLHFFQDNNRQVIRGCRGTVTFNIRAGEIPTMDFNLMGLYTKPATATKVAGSATYTVPRPVTDSNTPLWTFLDNNEQFLSSLVITQGNNVVYRNTVNHEEVYISDRKMTWSAEVAGVQISDFDYYSNLESHLGVDHAGRLRLHHGDTSGRYIRISADEAQLTTLSSSNSDELLIYNLDGVLTPEGSNEFSIEYV